jgi:protein gp37
VGDKTGIEWTDATWNPVTGCDRVSPGCDHCYAMTLAPRLKAMGSAHYQTDGDPRTSGPGFGLAMHPDALDKPIRWRRPRRIFVNSMSDLFHKDVTQEFIAQVFAVMALAAHHQFQVLTKRPGRMRSLLRSEDFHEQVVEEVTTMIAAGTKGPVEFMRTDAEHGNLWGPSTWPLANVWLGTSVEDQKWADVRVPLLLDTPAAVRFLSMEPLLGPVDLARALDRWEPNGAEWDAAPAGRFYARQMLHWIIVGGESGDGARPMHPQWARDLRDQAEKAQIAFLFKQWGAWASAEDSGVRNVRMSKNRFQYESVRFAPDGTAYRADQPDLYSHPGMTSMLRVGKHKAGRSLDGVTHDGYPDEAT